MSRFSEKALQNIKRAVSASNRRRVWSKEAREKLSKALKGKIVSVKTKKLLSSSAKKRWEKIPLEERKKLNANSRLGVKKFWAALTKEERYAINKPRGDKAGAAHTKRWKNMSKKERKRQRDAHSESEKKRWACASEEEKQAHKKRCTKSLAKARIAAAKIHKGVPLTAECRRKIGIASKKYWSTIPKDEQRARLEPYRRAACLALSTLTESSLERAIQKEFEAARVLFQKHKEFFPYIVDIFIPSRNLAVECDGEYWHETPKAKKYDQKRDKYLISRYKIYIVRVPERLIRKDPRLVVQTILKDS